MQTYFGTGSVSPRDFGAIADGKNHLISDRYGSDSSALASAQVDYPHVQSVSDEIDWAALQSAVDYCVKNLVPLDLDGGMYVTNKTLHISGNITLQNGKIIFNGTSTAVAIDGNKNYPSNPSSIEKLRVSVQNLTISSNHGAGTLGLDLGGLLQSTFTNVQVINFGNDGEIGVKLRSVYGSNFHGCNFNGNGTNLWITCYVTEECSVEDGDPSNANTFWGCKFNDATDDEQQSVMIELADVNSRAIISNQNKFYGCWIEDCAGGGVNMQSGANNAIVGCWFENCGGYYIRAKPPTSAPTADMLGLTIMSNQFASLTGVGSAHIKFSSRVYQPLIAGNTFPGGGEAILETDNHNDMPNRPRVLGNTNLADSYPYPDAHSTRDSRVTGNGTSDDRQQLQHADNNASGNLYFPPGVYSSGCNIDFVAGMDLAGDDTPGRFIFSKGAVLTPENGTTVTLKGVVEAGAYKIFDESSGGDVAVDSNYNVLSFPAWWDGSSTEADFAGDVVANGDLVSGDTADSRVFVEGSNVAVRSEDATLRLISERTSGDGNESFALVADVDASSIDEDHEVAVVRWRDDSDAEHDVHKFKPASQELVGQNGEFMEIKSTTTELTNLIGLKVDWPVAIPAGAEVLGVTSRITTALGTTNSTTGYQIGDAATSAIWADKTGTAAGTTTDLTDLQDTSRYVNQGTSAKAIYVVAKGGNFDGTGAFAWCCTTECSLLQRPRA